MFGVLRRRVLLTSLTHQQPTLAMLSTPNACFSSDTSSTSAASPSTPPPARPNTYAPEHSLPRLPTIAELITRVGGEPYRRLPTLEELANTKYKSRAAILPLVPPQRNGWTVETFLKRLARGCEAHVDKFKTWDDLFTMRGPQMRAAGIPTKQRRWILRWTEHFRQGLDPVFITLARSKARKNNPGMEKRRRQKYAGWAEYMFPDYAEYEKKVADRTEALRKYRDNARKDGLI